MFQPIREEIELKINQSAFSISSNKDYRKDTNMMITRGFATHAADSWNKVHDVEY